MVANHTRKIQHLEWLMNVVMVKMANGKWRMCVNFIDINNAYPIYSYPLPNIDVLVDNTSGCGILSFMDAYSNYNQIIMHPNYEDKRSFIGE